MQAQFDKLYEKGKQGCNFDSLMPIILDEKNILLAYRNIKSNAGANTPGTDNQTIKDIAKLPPEKIVAKVRNIMQSYHPRSVRRKEIEKPNGGIRPLGIPCIWDRLVQQCILQVLEPICESKFSECSNGFRPNRGTETAIAQAYQRIQQGNLHYCVEVDIKSFFDNVNHSKLIRQMWSMEIRDKKLICIIKEILKADVLLPDGTLIKPEKGTPQGGILSPLLSNIYLNELDKWVESQWANNPVTDKYAPYYNNNGSRNNGNAYAAMKKTNLKEMYIVRYADDFKIFCRDRNTAVKVMIAVEKWLKERLRLEISAEKSTVTNLKKNYMEFLGFQIKVRKKGNKYVVKSKMCEKAVVKTIRQLKEQIKEIAKTNHSRTRHAAICKYNAMVLGKHHYYSLATDVSLDFHRIGRQMDIIITNRLSRHLNKRKGKRSKQNTYKMLKEKWAKDKSVLYQIYGKSKQVKFVSGFPIVPAAYVQTRNAMQKKASINVYTEQGREEISKRLSINHETLRYLIEHPAKDNSLEYADNRISKFSAQKGRCAITGVILEPADIHCHHIKEKSMGGTDEFKNLVIIHENVHKLIHAVKTEIINLYMDILGLTNEQLEKVNTYRTKIGLEKIA